MTRILVLTSSALGAASVSNQLVGETLDMLKAHVRDLNVTLRDLGVTPVPHLSGDTVTAVRAEPATDAQRAARDLSDELVAELAAADIVLIGAPMYNFGMPSTLKAWFDHVLRAGVTFRYTEAGPEGLLTGKRAIVVETRGGFYSAGAAAPMDSQEPHLRALLGFIGITEIEFVRAENLAIGEAERGTAIAGARTQLRDLVQTQLAPAA